MEIWVNFEKSKNMGNVDMGKILKTLPIMVCQYMGKYSTYAPPPKFMKDFSYIFIEDFVLFFWQLI